VYQGIYRLPPAHFLSVTRQGVKIKRYWLLENTPRLRLKSDEEYVAAFLEIYSEAVRCRLRSARPVGIALSGGLDSGSAAAFAAKELAKKDRPLIALSAASLYDASAPLPEGRFEDAPFAGITARYLGNIDLAFIHSEHMTPLQGIERGLAIHDEPVHAASNQYWLIALWEEARQRGIGTLLIGGGGNNTISWHGSGYLAQLARQMRWPTLRRELLAWKTIHHKPLLAAIKQQVIKPLLPRTVKKWHDRWRKRTQPWEKYSAINMDFAHRLDLAKEMAKQGHDPFFSEVGSTLRLRYLGIKPGRSMVGYRSQQTAAAFELEMRDPTVDRRILEFCLSIPDHQYVREGEDRYLIRRAMTGILPDSVLNNLQRGLQATDIGRRVMENAPGIKAALQCLESESRLAKEFLDLKKMQDVLSNLQYEVNLENSTQARTILLRGLMTGLFLYRFETANQVK
jgi:asparagine synthase (glutamine-hydrolysing)